MSDGLTYLVADNAKAGVHVVDGERFEVIGFIPTGAGAHGIYPSRNAKAMYVSNRLAGSVSVIDQATRQVTFTFFIPGGGSPDMGSVFGRRPRAVAVGSLPQRRLRHRRARLEAARPHPGRIRAARAHVLPPTGALLPRPHRQLPLTFGRASGLKALGPTRTSWPRGSPTRLWSCRSPGCGTIRGRRR